MLEKNGGFATLINERPVPDCAYCGQPVSAHATIWNDRPFHQKCATEVMLDEPKVNVVEASQLRLPPSVFPSEVRFGGQVYQLAHAQYVCGLDVLQVLND